MGVLMIVAAVAAQQAELLPSQIAPMDVPSSIAMTSPSGVEVFQLVVSPEGKIVACTVRILGRGPVRDDRNCSKLLGSRATAARDQEGRGVYGAVKIRISWVVARKGQSAAPPELDEPDLYLPIQRLPPGFSNDAKSYLILITGAEGNVETCTVGRSSGHSGLDRAACRALADSGAAPLKDDIGKPVRAVQNVSVGFKVAP